MEFTFMDTIINSIQSDIARFIIVVAIAGTGAALALGETQGIVKRGVQVCFGGAIVVGCVSFASTLFGV